MATTNDPKFAEKTSLTAINKLITSIGKAANKLNDEIHNCAMMCLTHAREYGDTSPAARLVDALPKSFRRAGVIAWFSEFSPVTIAKGKDGDKMKAHLAGKIEERVWNVDEAKATPFYAMPEMQREPEVPTYATIHANVLQFIERTLKKVDKIENPEEAEKAKAEIEGIKAALAA